MMLQKYVKKLLIGKYNQLILWSMKNYLFYAKDIKFYN